MAKKPKANNQINSIRKTVVFSCAVLLIISAFLIWNNRSLSVAGTVDGERISVAELNFFWTNWMEHLMEMGMPGDSAETSDWALELAWEDLVELRVVVNQADRLGVVLTQEDMEQIEELIAFYNMMLVNEDAGINRIRDMGFTNASFRRFTEIMVLRDRVFQHVTDAAVAEIDEEQFQQDFEDFVSENFIDLKDVFVYFIEVETEEQASGLLAQVVQGADFEALYWEHSLTSGPMVMPGGETPTAATHAFNTPMNEEQIRAAYTMDVGVISEVLALENGHFSIFKVAEIEEIDRAEVEELFRTDYEAAARQNFFQEELFVWREFARVSPNGRVIN